MLRISHWQKPAGEKMLKGIFGGVGYEAPSFPSDIEWLNTDVKPTMEELKGQVVILDFWTYCCINCMHMIDTLRAIEEEYSDKPVFVIGVHSAKYKNENERANVEEAIKRYRISHPVIFDSRMQMWREYGVNAWPTLILIDPSGKVAHRHPGEIEPKQLGEAIDYILKKGGKGANAARIKTRHMDFDSGKRLAYPGKIAFSPNGKQIAVSDTANNRIVVADAQSGRVTDVVGSGAEGLLDGGFDSSRLSSPQGMAWPDENSLYVADTGNHSIRLADFRRKRLETVVGSGEKGGYVSFGMKYSSDMAQLNSPWDVCILGKTLYIAMAGLHQIWSMDMDSGRIGPFAGEGHENIRDGDFESALFAQPSGIFASKDALYVADSEVSSIRAVNLSTGYVSTIVSGGLFEYGDADGNIVNMSLQHPLGVSEYSGKIYIADTYNNAVKEVDIATGVSRRLVGREGRESACRLDDPRCETLGLYEPSDAKMNGSTLYIADTNNSLIRTFDLKSCLLGTFEIKGL